jgi:hypothetical protein
LGRRLLHRRQLRRRHLRWRLLRRRLLRHRLVSSITFRRLITVRWHGRNSGWGRAWWGLPGFHGPVACRYKVLIQIPSMYTNSKVLIHFAGWLQPRSPNFFISLHYFLFFSFSIRRRKCRRRNCRRRKILFRLLGGAKVGSANVVYLFNAFNK